MEEKELNKFRFYAIHQNGLDEPSQMHSFKTISELKSFLISLQAVNSELICQRITSNLYIITTESNLNELLTCKDIKKLKRIIAE